MRVIGLARLPHGTAGGQPGWVSLACALSSPAWFLLSALPLLLRPATTAIEPLPLLAVAVALWLATLAAAALASGPGLGRLRLLAPPALVLGLVTAQLAGVLPTALLAGLLAAAQARLRPSRPGLAYALQAAIAALAVDAGSVACGLGRGPALPLLVGMTVLAAMLLRHHGMLAALCRPGRHGLLRHRLGWLDLLLMALVCASAGLALGIITGDAGLRGLGAFLLAAVLAAPLVLLHARRRPGLG